MNRLAILGSTGSIGQSAVDVVRHRPGDFAVTALAAGTRAGELADQCREFSAHAAALSTEPPVGLDFGRAEVGCGDDAIDALVSRDDVDTVVAAIVGAAGLRSTLAAARAGKRIALANKEAMVVAGPLVKQAAAESGATIWPVDSEHSALLQALEAGPRDRVRRVILTASGGRFRNCTAAELDAVTPEEAGVHPTWDMGPKITIDSGTLMNKALEVIEAAWLFDLRPDQIDVVVHPQSIVHGLVEFVDGSVIAQLSPPDMKLPIQLALTWPDRRDAPTERLDLAALGRLDFEEPDTDRFPALRLAYDVLRAGGTAGAVLNAANEVAVQRFVDGDLRFTQIATLCRDVLRHHNHDPSPDLAGLMTQDRLAREEAARWNA